MLRSALLVFCGVFITGYVSAMVLVLAIFFRRGENTIHRVARLWAKMILFVSCVGTKVYGLENVPSDRPLIFMANHQSDFDIFLALAHIPGQFRWIAKKELYGIPLFGSAMRKAGYIPIDRFNHERALRSLDKAAEKVKQGKSLMTFPEGTRSKDGTIKPFKKGLFYLAIQSGVSIIPVSIIGSGDIMKKRSLMIQPRKTVMVIDKPIEAGNYSLEERDELMEKVRNVIIKNFHDESFQPPHRIKH